MRPFKSTVLAVVHNMGIIRQHIGMREFPGLLQDSESREYPRRASVTQHMGQIVVYAFIMRGFACSVAEAASTNGLGWWSVFLSDRQQF